MNLKGLKIKNFRGYRNETYVELKDLSVFTGKNDAGKSTILEALEIFFNNSIVKIDKEDLNIQAAADLDFKIEISCLFSDLPDSLIIDAANQTTLASEYLLNNDGLLEIKKIYNCAVATLKEQVYIIAHHPTIENGNDLLGLKIAGLRTRANNIGVSANEYNGTISSSIRAAIWAHLGNLNLATTSIQVDKDDTKAIWDYLSKWMPQYALFKSDRESTDEDKEVINPMKIAINNAIAEMQDELDAVQQKVMDHAINVANRTLAKLREMSPNLANSLTPDFKADPKWSGLFSLTINSDNGIPINKRGSGIRRLILLNFFRAEAERRRQERNSASIIYAFEEPENSQHPNHQKILISAFQELSESENTQVFITTHNPAIASLVSEDSLYLVTVDLNGNTTIQSGHPNILREIASNLGLLPSPVQPRLLVCVEGPNDVVFLKNISSIIHPQRQDLPNLMIDERVAIFPLGGATLKDWVNHDYLSALAIPQFHLYDLDDHVNPPYAAQVAQINARGGNNIAMLTRKRETENYIHHECVNQIYQTQLQAFGDMEDVPEIIARAVHNLASPNPWDELDKDLKKKKMTMVKRRINAQATLDMSIQLLEQSDPNNDIIGWLEIIRDRIQ
ncbi:MAG: ATP-binding protein [Flavipsychrobacter sp.]